MPRSGVTYSPMLQWILAAVWANYRPFGEFDELDGEQQSAIVAAYETSLRIEAIVALEQAKKVQQQSRRGGKK